MTITLNDAERNALRELAASECRSISDQARHMLRIELQRRGLPPSDSGDAEIDRAIRMYFGALRLLARRRREIREQEAQNEEEEGCDCPGVHAVDERAPGVGPSDWSVADMRREFMLDEAYLADRLVVAARALREGADGKGGEDAAETTAEPAASAEADGAAADGVSAD